MPVLTSLQRRRLHDAAAHEVEVAKDLLREASIADFNEHTPKKERVYRRLWNAVAPHSAQMKRFLLENLEIDEGSELLKYPNNFKLSAKNLLPNEPEEIRAEWERICRDSGHAREQFDDLQKHRHQLYEDWTSRTQDLKLKETALHNIETNDETRPDNYWEKFKQLLSNIINKRRFKTDEALELEAESRGAGHNAAEAGANLPNQPRDDAHDAAERRYFVERMLMIQGLEREGVVLAATPDEDELDPFSAPRAALPARTYYADEGVPEPIPPVYFTPTSGR